MGDPGTSTRRIHYGTDPPGTIQMRYGRDPMVIQWDLHQKVIWQDHHQVIQWMMHGTTPKVIWLVTQWVTGPMDGGPGGADPLFGEAGPAGGPPPGDMPPGDPMGEPGMDGGPGGADGTSTDDMGGMHSHMDDAAAHGPQDPGPGTPDPMAGDMDGDGMMPPPPTDDPVDDGMA